MTNKAAAVVSSKCRMSVPAEELFSNLLPLSDSTWMQKLPSFQTSLQSCGIKHGLLREARVIPEAKKPTNPMSFSEKHWLLDTDPIMH